jgi:putative membrane protein
MESERGGVHYWFYGGQMIWMAIWWLVGIGLLFMFIWLLAEAISGRLTAKESPEDILRRRYAAGDMDTEEYERRLKELRKMKSAA